MADVVDAGAPADDVASEPVVQVPAISNRAQRRQAASADSGDAVPVADMPAPGVEPEAQPVIVEQAADVPAQVVDAAPAAETVYRVAPGKSMNSRRGMLNGGDVVTVADFSDQERMDELVDAKALVRS
jgi:hypothetical protein